MSDPGEGLVQAVIEAGFPVSVVPGPSAPSLALVGSGLPMTPHLFAGFPPRKAGALRSYLDSTLGPWTTIFFESPKRVENLLLTLSDRIPADGQIVVARELTKQFEKYHRGSGLRRRPDLLKVSVSFWSARRLCRLESPMIWSNE